MKKLFTRFGKFAIVLIALDLAVAITIIACSALFLTGCGDEYILPEEIRERELEELAAFEPYIDEDGMVHVSPWFAYPRDVVEDWNAAETIEDPLEISWDPYNNGADIYTLIEEELVDVKYGASYLAPCVMPKQCYYARRILITKCWGEYSFVWDYNIRPEDACPEEGR